ncbi:MAG: hypothetical protein ACLFTA_02980 [Candidatus Nanohaloarchaea archaeon]
MKAQSSMEFVTIVAMATLLASPFIIQSQDSLFETSQSSELSRFQASLDDLKQEIERVDAMGEPARDTATISVPSSIEKARTVGNSVVYTRNVSGRASNFSRIVDAELNTASLPMKKGEQQVEVEAWKNQVNLSAR